MSFRSTDDYNENETDKDRAKVAGAGGLFGATPGAGGKAPSGQPVKPNSSGSWTNLNQYLAANQEQAGQMANAVVGGVENKAKDARDTLQAADQSFKADVDKATVQADQGLFDEIQTNAAGVKNDPTKAANWNKIYNAVYEGPTDPNAAFQDAASKYNKAEQAFGSAKTETGRKQLLQETYQRPDYSSGMQNLDQMLVQRSGAGQKAFNELQGKYQGFGQEDDAALSNAAAYAGEGKAKTEGAKTGAKSALETAVKSFGTSLGDRVTQAQKAAEAAWGDLARSQSSQVPQQSGPTYGVDPFANDGSGNYQYFTRPVATAQNVATEDDYAQIQALEALAGGQVPSEYFGQFTQPGVANTFKAAPEFQRSAFDAAVNSNRTKYDLAANPFKESITQTEQWIAEDPGARQLGRDAYTKYLADIEALNALNRQYGVSDVYSDRYNQRPESRGAASGTIVTQDPTHVDAPTDAVRG